MKRQSNLLHRRMGMWIGSTALAFLSSTANAAVSYTFASFDGPGNNGGGTTVNGINNAGQVVGFSSDNAANPTLFTNFIRNPNGTFQSLNIDNDPLAMANGINNAGTVVGGTSSGAAFELQGANFSALPPVIPGDTGSQTAFGLNEAGQIVGQFTQNSTDTTPGYLYSHGVYTTLTPVANAAVTNAQGVNNNGLVAGFYSSDGQHQHGFLYNISTQLYTLLPDPVVPNLFLTQFLGLNDEGVAVGYYQTNDGSQHGFLFNTTTDVYTFLDDPSASTNGFSITQITGINDSGELTGFYVDAATGLQRGFVATLAVPEPATWTLMLAAFAGLGFANVRSRRRSAAPA